MVVYICKVNSHIEHCVRYSYSVSSIPFDIDVLCNKNNNEPLAKALHSSLGEDLSSNPPKFIRRFEQVVYRKDIGDEEICKDNLKGMAIVKFQLASKVITRIKKTKRVSFSDHVSNIGKTF